MIILYISDMYNKQNLNKIKIDSSFISCKYEPYSHFIDIIILTGYEEPEIMFAIYKLSADLKGHGVVRCRSWRWGIRRVANSLHWNS